MRMSIISRLLLATFGAIAFLLVPQFAAKAEAADTYLFFYEKNDADKIKQYVEAGNVNGLKPITSVNILGLPDNDGKKVDFLLKSINKSTQTAKYGGEVTCKGHTFTLYAYVKIPDNFNNKNELDGQLKFEGPGNGNQQRECFPDGMDADNTKTISLLNSTKGDNLEKFKAGIDRGNGAGDASDTPSEPEAQAECTAPGFGWLICGAIKYFQEFTTWVEDNLIAPMFTTTPLSFNTDQKENPQYAAWNATRAIANVFFVLVFIVIIFANLFGLQAYNVKKILPKLVVAAVLIQASYFFMAAAIDVTNILGRGIREIMAGIMPDVQYQGGVSGGFVTLGAGLLIAAALASKVAAVGIFAAALPLAIGILAVMITLVLRQTLIVLIILTAPLAIAAMILPNTERFFKSWMNTFIKLLLMYPMIIMLFAAGRLAAYATLSSNTSLNGALSPIIAMLCMALPLVAVPFTFSWAGGLMSKVNSGVFKGGAKIQGGVDDKLKGRREEYRRKATLNANPSLSGWNRLNPRQRWQNKVAGGGFFYNSASAKRKIGESQEKILGQDEKSYGRLFDTQVRNGADRTSLLMDIANGNAKSKGFKNDQAAVNFAIGKLAQSRDFASIRTLKQSGANATAVNAAINNSFSDISKAAPDITNPTGSLSAIDTLGAASLADLDHTTLSAYLDDQSVTAQERATRADHIGRLVVDAHADDQVRNKFNNGKLLGVIHQRANGQGGNGLGNYTQQVQQIVQQAAPGQQGAPGTARFI